jgi:hypothetical protein
MRRRGTTGPPLWGGLVVPLMGELVALLGVVLSIIPVSLPTPAG